MADLVENQEHDNPEIQDAPKDLQSVADLKRSIAFYQKQLNEADESSDNLKLFFKLNIDIKESNLEDAETVEYFKGKIRKAVKLMWRINAVDAEDMSEKEYSKLANKIRHLVDQEELKIKLQIKALEKKLYAVERVNSKMRYESADMWFYHIKDLVKEKKEQ